MTQFVVQLVAKKSYAEHPLIWLLIAKTHEIRVKWIEAIQLAQ